MDNNEIGVIMMEVMRDQGPKDGFLEKVRNLATERGIVLIFDECTSGFRQSFGGIHKIFNVDPDMAVFGKAIGNGYALTQRKQFYRKIHLFFVTYRQHVNQTVTRQKYNFSLPRNLSTLETNLYLAQ